MTKIQFSILATCMLCATGVFSQQTISIPGDMNGDCVVGATDIVDFLPLYQTEYDGFVVLDTSCRNVVYNGDFYEVVRLGDQCWFAENLRTEAFQNGDSIFRVENFTQVDSIADLGLPMCSEFQFDTLRGKYGLFYSNQVILSDVEVCPVGWRVPAGYNDALALWFGNLDEWDTSIAGKHLHGGSNSSGFGAYLNGVGSGYIWYGFGQISAYWLRPNATEMTSMGTMVFNNNGTLNFFVSLWGFNALYYNDSLIPIRCVRNVN